MIIDVHAHVCAPPELYQWKSVLMSARGAHGFAPKRFPDDWVRDHPDTQRNLRIGYNQAARIIEMLEKEGTISIPSMSGTRKLLDQIKEQP